MTYLNYYPLGGGFLVAVLVQCGPGSLFWYGFWPVLYQLVWSGTGMYELRFVGSTEKSNRLLPWPFGTLCPQWGETVWNPWEPKGDLVWACVCPGWWGGSWACIAVLVRARKRVRGIQKKQGPPLGESRERLNVLTSTPNWTLESNTMALSDLWPLGSRKAELLLVDTIMVLLIPSIINDILCQDSLLCFSRQICLPSLVCFFSIYVGRWWIILRAATLTAITRQKLPIWSIWPTSWTVNQDMLWCTDGYHRDNGDQLGWHFSQGLRTSLRENRGSASTRAEAKRCEEKPVEGSQE